MIIERAIGEIKDQPYCSREVDWLEIEWYQTHKKIDRRQTCGGTEVGIRMDHETGHRGWRQGDVLCESGDTVIAIRILPAKCIRVWVQEPALLVKFCYEIGNRHAPFFYGEEKSTYLIPYDKPIQVMIEKLGLKPEIKMLILDPERRISSAHGQGHSHAH